MQSTYTNLPHCPFLTHAPRPHLRSYFPLQDFLVQPAVVALFDKTLKCCPTTNLV